MDINLTPESGTVQPEVPTEHPNVVGPASICLILFTVLFAVLPLIVLSARPGLVAHNSTGNNNTVITPGSAAFLGSWAIMAFPSSIILAITIFYLPSCTCNQTLDSTDPEETKKRVVSYGCFTLWALRKPKISFEDMSKYYWLGIGFTVPVYFAEMLLMYPIQLSGINRNVLGTSIAVALYQSFIVAALIEESAKFLLSTVLNCHIRDKYPHLVVSLIACGALGFATTENYGYILSVINTGDLGEIILTAFARCAISVPFHVSTAFWMSVVISRDFGADIYNYKTYFRSTWLPMVCHGLYDFCLFSSEVLVMIHKAWFVLVAIPIVIFVSLLVVSYRRVLELVDSALVDQSTSFV
eukprot:TRINITY_DN9631_c0_g1_i1.p1 TRINITY_DN9631_c0_g1~~TRINITY_DN9631_c0_g1_i1.p1  ORF type:complete len:355 (-),score=43.16 TRINITY_DN9631_c0_g1_i1:191-1255(-)